MCVLAAGLKSFRSPPCRPWLDIHGGGRNQVQLTKDMQMIRRGSRMEEATPASPQEAVGFNTVRALLLGDRIDTSGLEHRDVLLAAPLAFRAGQNGIVTVFRYGVVVFYGLSVLEEDEVLRSLRARIV